MAGGDQRESGGGEETKGGGEVVAAEEVLKVGEAYLSDGQEAPRRVDEEHDQHQAELEVEEREEAVAVVPPEVDGTLKKVCELEGKLAAIEREKVDMQNKFRERDDLYQAVRSKLDATEAEQDKLKSRLSDTSNAVDEAKAEAAISKLKVQHLSENVASMQETLAELSSALRKLVSPIKRFRRRGSTRERRFRGRGSTGGSLYCLPD